MKESHELNDVEKRKIESGCANAPASSTAHIGLEERGKMIEDAWFRKHEAELLEEARKRKSKGTKGGTTYDNKCCSEG